MQQLRFFIFLASFFSIVQLLAQNPVFPVKEQEIHWEEIVAVPQAHTNELNERWNKFVSKPPAGVNFSKKGKDATGANIAIVRIVVQPSAEKISQVEAELKCRVYAIQGKYSYEIHSPILFKENIRYSAYLLYQGVQKGKPYVKTTLEKESVALARHEELLRMFDQKMKSFLSEMKKTMGEVQE